MRNACVERTLDIACGGWDFGRFYEEVIFYFTPMLLYHGTN